MTTDDATTVIRLTKDEALVLFEWLAQLEERTEMRGIARAEQVALWALEAQLEKSLVEILQPNYQDVLRKARLSLER